MDDAEIFSGTGTAPSLLRAAFDTFSSYGYRRTSLDDIARQANVSRPTIYTYFKNKEDIMRAVSQGIHDATIAAIQDALAANAPLTVRLEEAFWAWSKPFMGILFGSRHGAELIGAGSALAADISANAYAQFLSEVRTTLKRAQKDGDIDLSQADLTIAGAAEFLVLSLNGLSSGDADEATYRKRLSTLVSVFVSAVTPK